MAQVLVTGGAGFIGSHLVRGLLDRGDQVRVLDNLSTGSKANITDLEVDFIEGDIRDVAVVQESIKDVEAIYHLAAFVSVPGSMVDPLTCYAVNLNGSLNVLMQANQAGVRRVVLASSAAVYGESESTVAENHPLNPLSPYAASKLAMEQAAKLFSESFSLETVCLRYFNVYGPRQSPDSQYAAAVPIFIGAMFAGEAPMIFGDGSQTRDFIYVGDVVRALLLAAEQEKAKGEVMNIGGGASISILELVEVVRDLLPEAPETTFGAARIGDIRYSQAVITKAKMLLDFSPEISIRDGLQETIRWFRSR